MNELFTFLSVVLVPLTASIFLYLYRSKCSSVNICWGLLQVSRNVDDETRIDVSNNQSTTDIINSI
jgi:hypothetical protein